MVRFLHRKAGFPDSQFATYDVVPFYVQDLVHCPKCAPSKINDAKKIPDIPAQPTHACEECTRRWNRCLDWLALQLAAMLVMLSKYRIFISPGGRAARTILDRVLLSAPWIRKFQITLPSEHVSHPNAVSFASCVPAVKSKRKEYSMLYRDLCKFLNPSAPGKSRLELKKFGEELGRVYKPFDPSSFAFVRMEATINGREKIQEIIEGIVRDVNWLLRRENDLHPLDLTHSMLTKLMCQIHLQYLATTTPPPPEKDVREKQGASKPTTTQISKKHRATQASESLPAKLTRRNKRKILTECYSYLMRLLSESKDKREELVDALEEAVEKSSRIRNPELIRNPEWIRNPGWKQIILKEFNRFVSSQLRVSEIRPNTYPSDLLKEFIRLTPPGEKAMELEVELLDKSVASITSSIWGDKADEVVEQRRKSEEIPKIPKTTQVKIVPQTKLAVGMFMVSGPVASEIIVHACREVLKEENLKSLGNIEPELAKSIVFGALLASFREQREHFNAKVSVQESTQPKSKPKKKSKANVGEEDESSKQEENGESQVIESSEPPQDSKSTGIANQDSTKRKRNRRKQEESNQAEQSPVIESSEPAQDSSIEQESAPRQTVEKFAIPGSEERFIAGLGNMMVKKGNGFRSQDHIACQATEVNKAFLLSLFNYKRVIPAQHHGSVSARTDGRSLILMALPGTMSKSKKFASSSSSSSSSSTTKTTTTTEEEQVTSKRKKREERKIAETDTVEHAKEKFHSKKSEENSLLFIGMDTGKSGFNAVAVPIPIQQAATNKAKWEAELHKQSQAEMDDTKKKKKKQKLDTQSDESPILTEEQARQLFARALPTTGTTESPSGRPFKNQSERGAHCITKGTKKTELWETKLRMIREECLNRFDTCFPEGQGHDHLLKKRINLNTFDKWNNEDELQAVLSRWSVHRLLQIAYNSGAQRKERRTTAILKRGFISRATRLLTKDLPEACVEANEKFLKTSLHFPKRSPQSREREKIKGWERGSISRRQFPNTKRSADAKPLPAVWIAVDMFSGKGQRISSTFPFQELYRFILRYIQSRTKLAERVMVYKENGYRSSKQAAGTYSYLTNLERADHCRVQAMHLPDSWRGPPNRVVNQFKYFWCPVTKSILKRDPSAALTMGILAICTYFGAPRPDIWLPA